MLPTHYWSVLQRVRTEVAKAAIIPLQGRTTLPMPEMSFFGVDAAQMRQICLDVGKVGHLQACYCGSRKGQVAKPGTQAESLAIWLLLDLHLIWEKVSHPIVAQG